MEDPIYKQKYQKYKLRVKLWEKDFKKKHGRIPSKYDIREASQEIRDSYKMYYKLKTSFLENTLNDVLSDDGFDILEMSQKDVDVSLLENSGGPQLPFNITKLVDEDNTKDDSKQSERWIDVSKVQDILEPSMLSNIVKSNESHVSKAFQSVKVLPLNERAWGSNLSQKASIKEKKVMQQGLKVNFNAKLFQNSSFSKRNPRKSLSKTVLDHSFRGNQSISGDILDTKNKEILPDLETILLQKSKEQQVALIIASDSLLAAEKSKENLKTQVDEGWLERNAAQNGYETSLTIKIKKEQSTNPKSKKNIYGLSNLNAPKLPSEEYFIIEQPMPSKETTQVNSTPNLISKKSEEIKCQGIISNRIKSFQKDSICHDSDSVVDDSDEDEKSPESRHIIKRRKVTLNLTKNISSVKKISEMEHGEKKNLKTKGRKYLAKITPTKTNTKKLSSENSNKVNRKERNTIVNARVAKNEKMECEKLLKDFDDKPLNPKDLELILALERGNITAVPRIKLKDLANADTLVQNYIRSKALDGAVVSKLPISRVDEKRSEARRKLEEKISTRKLNENFVTINIQKKKFVRGKKSVNYSKYKKKLWKHNKNIAALSGPNMDMRGCDGGSLKCFNCGQTGHFAPHCKMRGDSLLPLTVQLDEENSPFPTLEEAERMASESAAAVHSRNIGKLPQAPNIAIYNQILHSEKDVEDKVNVSRIIIDLGNDREYDSVQMEEQNRIETDEDLKRLDIDSACLRKQKAISPIKKYIGSKIPEEFLKAAGIDLTDLSLSKSIGFKSVDPLYDLSTDGNVKEITDEVWKTLRMFGHNNFRKGQDRAIMRILSGMSTLVTLSTGSGKSLCYQLPAYLYSKYKNAITLVISPLVSLMEDQVTGVPHFLRALCLHTNQTPQQKMKVMKLISDGQVDVLLVSPEAVVAGERSTGFGSILRQLPPIAFACIDEAHCVSQWSHNFRPSYLMVCKVLRQNLGVKCVLGLTATATLPTRMSIIDHLGITDGEAGIISDVPLPDNLILTVSKDECRDSALLHLLLSKRFAACQSIIVYCTRRDECERIAGYLRTCLQDCKAKEQLNVKKKRKRVNWYAEPYHAGMPASRRRTIQNAFMSNELRIVVATVAFGMGINKPDIRAVVHYNMPRSFESYVQEVGRAGRDNKISHCHLFLDANDGDQYELKKHIYANSLDRHVIRKLLQRVFVPCSCDKNTKQVTKTSAMGNAISKETPVSKFNDEGSSNVRARICKGHEIGFSIEKTVEVLDIPEENISTLLCYMELDNRWGVNVLSHAYMKAKVISYGGPKYLKHAAKECPPLAMAIAMEIKNGSFKEGANIIEFSVVDVAAAIGWNSGVVKYQLKNLEWAQVSGVSKRSPITVTFYDLGFRIKAPGDFTADEVDDALDTLYNRCVNQEYTQLIQLQYIFQGLSSVAYNSYSPCSTEGFSHDRSDQLKGIIRDYFHNEYPKNLKLEIKPLNVSDSELEIDIISLINMYPENNFSGRNIARIFHGISSPNYPALMWHRCKYWRVHSKTDFNRIVQLANNVIVKRRT